MAADSDIYAYQLPHLPLDKDASLQGVATYLNELENVQHSYKDMSKKLYTTTITVSFVTVMKTTSKQPNGYDIFIHSL